MRWFNLHLIPSTRKARSAIKAPLRLWRSARNCDLTLGPSVCNAARRRRPPQRKTASAYTPRPPVGCFGEPLTQPPPPPPPPFLCPSRSPSGAWLRLCSPGVHEVSIAPTRYIACSACHAGLHAYAATLAAQQPLRRGCPRRCHSAHAALYPRHTAAAQHPQQAGANCPQGRFTDS